MARWHVGTFRLELVVERLLRGIDFVQKRITFNISSYMSVYVRNLVPDIII